MNEEWKDIEGFEGMYQVSNLGNVRSVERLVNYKNIGKALKSSKTLIPKKTKAGYYELILSNGNIRKCVRIHRLVAEAFIANPNNYPVINHINGVKTDNRVENLEWCTVQYNTQDYYSKTIRVYQYSLNGELLKIWDSVTNAAESCDGDKTGVQHCCCNELKTYKGFIWSYIPLNSEECVKRNINKKIRKVGLFDDNNNLIQSFLSMKEASTYAKCNPSFISMCCKGIRKSNLGTWKIIEED